MEMTLKQYEIWLINLDPAIGAEIKKTRPCVVINNNDIGLLPLKIVAPLTDHKPHYDKNPWMLTVNPDKFNNLEKKSVIDLFQLRSISEIRFIRKLGELNPKIAPSIPKILEMIFEPEM